MPLTNQNESRSVLGFAQPVGLMTVFPRPGSASLSAGNKALMLGLFPSITPEVSEQKRYRQFPVPYSTSRSGLPRSWSRFRR